MFNEKEYEIFDETLAIIQKFHLQISDSDDACDLDGDDVQQKVEECFKIVDIDQVLDKLMSVLTASRDFPADDFASAVRYFAFVVDFYHDWLPTMSPIAELATLLVDKYDFNVNVTKACFLNFMLHGQKDENGWPIIADDVPTKSIINLLDTICKLMDCMEEKFTLNLLSTGIMHSLMHIMAHPRSAPSNLDDDHSFRNFLGAVLSIIYMAINCAWETTQKMLSGDEYQFAIWKMVDYKHECRKDDLIKLRSSCIVSLLITEEERIKIMEETTRMFVTRMEAFADMTAEEKTTALQNAARKFTHDEIERAEYSGNHLSDDFDMSDLNLD